LGTVGLRRAEPAAQVIAARAIANGIACRRSKLDARPHLDPLRKRTIPPPLHEDYAAQLQAAML